MVIIRHRSAGDALLAALGRVGVKRKRKAFGRRARNFTVAILDGAVSGIRSERSRVVFWRERSEAHARAFERAYRRAVLRPESWRGYLALRGAYVGK